MLFLSCSGKDAGKQFIMTELTRGLLLMIYSLKVSFAGISTQQAFVFVTSGFVPRWRDHQAYLEFVI